jgi:hypothetical protein
MAECTNYINTIYLHLCRFKTVFYSLVIQNFRVSFSRYIFEKLVFLGLSVAQELFKAWGGV